MPWVPSDSLPRAGIQHPLPSAPRPQDSPPAPRGPGPVHPGEATATGPSNLPSHPGQGPAFCFLFLPKVAGSPLILREQLGKLLPISTPSYHHLTKL